MNSNIVDPNLRRIISTMVYKIDNLVRQRKYELDTIAKQQSAMFNEETSELEQLRRDYTLKAERLQREYQKRRDTLEERRTRKVEKYHRELASINRDLNRMSPMLHPMIEEEAGIKLPIPENYEPEITEDTGPKAS